MTKQTRRRFSPEYKEQSVARLLEPAARHSSVAAKLGVTPTQLKTWRLELEAAGSAVATAAQKAEAAELLQLRRDNKRLTEEVEVLRKASALFRSMGGEEMKTKHAFVAAHASEHAIGFMCRVLGGAHSRFHDRRRAAPKRTERCPA